MKIKRFNKQLNNDRGLLIVGGVLILVLIILGFVIIKGMIKKPTGNENITTNLKIESDFLEWFKDFNNLYNRKVEAPSYSLQQNVFEEINKFINEDKDTRVIFKDNKYLLDDMSVEFDIKTRSLRYIKYNKEKIFELLEVNLINGKYYVILKNKDYIYKIKFNKDEIKLDKFKNKDHLVTIENSIFGINNFEW